MAVASSRDGGATWGTPVMVHFEAANNFFNDKPWIAAGAGGDVYGAARRGLHLLTHRRVGIARSRPDLDNFGSQTRVSTQSSNPYLQFSGSFIGDYTGVAVDSKGGVHTVWTDGRGLPGTTTPNQDTVVGSN